MRLILLPTLMWMLIGCTRYSPVAFDKSQLVEVQDDTVAVLSPGFEKLLMHSRSVWGASLEKAGAQVPYAELMADPEKYRGEPISIQGVLLRVFELPLPMVFAPGDDELPNAPFEAWILNAESQPYRIILTRLPAGWEKDQKLREVKATGYFLMREGVEDDARNILWQHPTLIAQRIASANDTTVKADFKIRYSSSEFKKDAMELPDIKVGLVSDDQGNLLALTLGRTNLGNDDEAFERLNREILKIIGKPGNPMTEEISVKIDSDFECQCQYVAKAISSCRGRFDPETKTTTRYIKHIRLTPPHDPRD